MSRLLKRLSSGRLRRSTESPGTAWRGWARVNIRRLFPAPYGRHQCLASGVMPCHRGGHGITYIPRRLLPPSTDQKTHRDPSRWLAALQAGPHGHGFPESALKTVAWLPGINGHAVRPPPTPADFRRRVCWVVVAVGKCAASPSSPSPKTHLAFLHFFHQVNRSKCFAFQIAAKSILLQVRHRCPPCQTF